MSYYIDCLLIGYNEINAQEFEEKLNTTGTQSGAYRDFSLNVVRYHNKLYSATEMFNLFYRGDGGSDEPRINKPQPLNSGETFSATIAYLGTFLNKKGMTFDFVNSFREKKDELVKKLEQENIYTIAITTTLYVSVIPILEIIDFIKKHNRTAKIIVGGPYVSNQVRNLDPESLNYLFEDIIGADFFVNDSQGETALVNIILALKNNLPLEKINNIYYKTKNGFAATPGLKENNPLSRNMVNWNLFTPGIGEYANVRTAISCPFSCSFCGFPQHAGDYQTAAVEKIEKELNQLDVVGTVKSIYFIDDTFNVPMKRFKEILKMLKRNRYKFKWHSYFRCQYIDRETVELMKESGCEGVFLGIESGNDGILTNMNKAAGVEKYLTGISLLKEYGIITYGNFIVGFPGETIETVEDTVRFIKNSGLGFYRAQLWYCDPITPIWKEKEKYNLKGRSFEWSHATMDSKRAADIIEKMFLPIETTVWVPQYNFDFDALFHLMHRNMSLEQIKLFLRCFNKGIREQLMNPDPANLSPQVINQIKNACQINPQNLQEFTRDFPDSNDEKNSFDEDFPEFAFEELQNL